MPEESLTPQSTQSVEIVRFTQEDETYTPGFYQQYGWSLWIGGGLVLTLVLCLILKLIEVRHR